MLACTYACTRAAYLFKLASYKTCFLVRWILFLKNFRIGSINSPSPKTDLQPNNPQRDDKFHGNRVNIFDVSPLFLHGPHVIQPSFGVQKKFREELAAQYFVVASEPLAMRQTVYAKSPVCHGLVLKVNMPSCGLPLRTSMTMRKNHEEHAMQTLL